MCKVFLTNHVCLMCMDASSGGGGINHSFNSGAKSTKGVVTQVIGYVHCSQSCVCVLIPLELNFSQNVDFRNFINTVESR